MSVIRMAVIGRMIVSAICACGAFALAIEGKEGWGWFLFISLLLGGFSLSEMESKE